MLSGREAVGRLISATGIERVALMDSPWGDTLSAWVAQGYPTRPVFRRRILHAAGIAAQRP